MLWWRGLTSCEGVYTRDIYGHGFYVGKSEDESDDAVDETYEKARDDEEASYSAVSIEVPYSQDEHAWRRIRGFFWGGGQGRRRTFCDEHGGDAQREYCADDSVAELWDILTAELLVGCVHIHTSRESPGVTKTMMPRL